MGPMIESPKCNKRVSCDSLPINARSESVVAANPLDPYNLVASSKKFTDPAKYQFVLAAYASFDGGLSWRESSLSMIPSNKKPGDFPWVGNTDPALAWDNQGNAYLVALPTRPPQPGEQCTFPDLCGVGIAIYKSSDGGRTWQAPLLIHESEQDDKQ